MNYTGAMNFSRGRLRGHRNGLGLSQVELGARVGIPADHVAEYEQGDRIPDPLTQDALAAALGISPRSLRSVSANWAEDYVDAALSHAQPLQPQDIDRAAHALRSPQ